jgi:hypothetical protein
VGGTIANDENSSIAKCEKLDLETKVWSALPDCKVKTSGCALIAFKNRFIFKIGGKIDIFTPSTAIEAFDLTEGRWVLILLNICLV